jgi:glycosyltransferase involved in cell wall biosynthesis
MIDRNSMVDRRIVLEAKLLREVGQRVALVASYGMLGDNEREIDGLPILRFNESTVAEYGEDPDLTDFEQIWNDILHELPQLRAALSRAEDQLSLERYKGALGLLRPFIGRKLGMVMAALLAPRFAANRAVAAQRLPRLVKVGAVAVFALLSLNLRMLWRLPQLLREGGGVRSSSTRLRIAELRFRISCAKVAVLPPARGALAEGLRRLAHPRYGLVQLRKSPGGLKVLRGMLTLLTGDLYLICRIGRFARGDFPFFILDGMPEVIVDHFRKLPLDTWEQAVLDFACALDRIDVVHAHDLPTLRVAVLIAQKRGIRLVYDAHELYSYQPGVIGARKKRLFDTEHALIGFCDEIVCINADQAVVMQKDHGRGRYTPLTNATEQPEGFDITQRYTLVQDYIGLPKGTPTMLFMGGINRGRKIDLLLEGIAQASVPVHMIFLTWGMEIPEFERMATKLGIRERVHFLDPVPWSEIVYWAASVDVGVMPYQALDLNTRISSPNKMYEFIAAGTPMIGSSELINVAKVVPVEGFGVLLPFHEAADYARAIDEIFDPAAGGPERFRANLIARADKYLWKAEASGFEAMYARLLADDYAPRARAPA